LAQTRVSGSIGFGGTGITKIVSVDGADTKVDRSEGPGVIAVSLERLVSRQFVVSVDHLRGFRLGPFSSGIGFTGVTLKWYFLSPAMPLQPMRSDATTIMSRTFSPYAGGSTGIADGTAVREADKVQEISASGIYLGVRGGVDYALTPTMALRAELSLSQVLFSSALVKSSVQEFSIRAGVVLGLF
jgi:hypothetical protein